MNVTNPTTRTSRPLDQVRISDFERRQAEAALLRGEFIADLLIDGCNVLRNLLGSLKAKPRTAENHHLDPV